MRKVLVGALVGCLMAVPISGAFGRAPVKRLGTDPSRDSAPAIDITYLDVTTHGILTDDGPKRGLEIRIGLDGMLPTLGSYPEVPAFEWIFQTGGRRFIAEAVAGRTPRFFLFELHDDSYEQLAAPWGAFDPAAGYLKILVPLDAIGAKKGSVITGVREPLEIIGNNGADVDVHAHHATGTEYIDEMTTTKSYVVP